MKKNFKSILFPALGGIFCAGIALTFAGCDSAAKVEMQSVSAERIADTQETMVTWETEGAPSKVVVKVKNTNGKIKAEKTITDPTLLANAETTIETTYGKNIVEVTAYNGNKTSTKKEEIDIFTDEYIIAPLVATMPVTSFSLQLKQITNNYTIPTFVWLQRGSAWDYSKLPENVYLIPEGNYSSMSGYNDAGVMYSKTSAWIKELYEMNNDSTFHFYCNDFHPYGWMQAFIVNEIPASNYDVTLLSDGTASTAVFNRNFAGADAIEKLSQSNEKYEQFKKDIMSLGYGYNDKNLKSKIDTRSINNYVFSMLENEDNVKLILTNKYNLSNEPSQSSEMNTWIANKISEGKITISGLGGLLSNLQAQGDEEVARIKALYNFSGDYFADAIDNNKTAMVIMGTRTASENNFKAFVAATKAYYGTENYSYYYKGHPGTPTDLDANKAKMLNEIGLTDVDSNIAAELIFFFSADKVELIATGYDSSTYNSLPEEQVGGIWGIRLNDISSERKDKVDFAITKLTSSNSDYGSLATENSYLLEFKDTTNYEFAIYNYKTNTLKFYKTVSGEFVEVPR